ncbi:MAG: DUF2461 domain-containing protein [Thermoplasmatota archaeon]
MTFTGFPKDMISFFSELRENNEKEWFDENRDRYERSVMTPSKEFVISMGDRIREIVPGINAIPRVNKSLFRINRDVRFSPDKSPYKTNIGIWFWEGEGKRMDNSGFYFHLDPDSLMLGVGVYMFPKEMMEKYRLAVIDDDLGEKLASAVETVGSLGYEIGEIGYKKVPRGFPPDHPRAELLRFKGLTAIEKTPHPPDLHSEKILDYSMKRFRDMMPIHERLVEMIRWNPK